MAVSDKVYALMDLAFQALLFIVGFSHSDGSDCRLQGITHYLMASGAVFGFFSVLRLLDLEVNLFAMQLANVRPLINLSFVYWGRKVSLSQLSSWSLYDAESPGYCKLAPMVTAVSALLVQLVFFFFTLFYVASMVIVVWLLWAIVKKVITGSFIPFLFNSVMRGLGLQ